MTTPGTKADLNLDGGSAIPRTQRPGDADGRTGWQIVETCDPLTGARGVNLPGSWNTAPAAASSKSAGESHKPESRS
jgi:hypothetical protein